MAGGRFVTYPSDGKGAVGWASKPVLLRSVCLLMVAGVAQAAELAGDVAAYVEQLSSPERAVRVAAEQALLRGGPELLDRLPATESVADPAARSALLRIRQRLETLRIEQQTAATLVTLEGAATLGEMTDRLSAATTRPIGSDRTDRQLLIAHLFALTIEQSEQRVELNIRRQPFWKAVDELAAKAGLRLSGTDANGRFTFRPRTGEDDATRIGYSGAFRIEAGPVELRPVAGRDDQRLARLGIELRSEHKLRPLFVSYGGSDVTLVTAEGDRLASFTPAAKYELPFGEGGHAIDLRFNFLAPAEQIAEPLTFGAALKVTAAAGTESLDYAFDGTSPKEHSRGGVTVRFREATLHADGTAEVELSVVYETGGPAFESHRTWVYHNRADVSYRRNDGELVTIDHEPGFSTIAQSDGGVVLRYRFEDIPPDATPVFNYRAPTKIVVIPVDVEIGGLVVKE